MNLTEPKSLLIGASGQIGTQIMRILGPDRCLATSRNPKSENALPLDLARISTKDDAELILDDHALDAIYCVAGVTNVEDREQSVEQAYFTNCRGLERLAEVASERKIPLVYFSTEYVFDGTDGPYRHQPCTLLVGLPTSAMGQKARRPLSAGLSIERLSSLLPHLKMRCLIDGITAAATT